MIASVAFRNFKALRNTSLRLTEFNLVIGPNGSGKSSLIEVLQQLRTLSRLSPTYSAQSQTPREGGPEIAFQFSPPLEAIRLSMICLTEIQCDTLLVEPRGALGWEDLQRGLGGIRSYLFDHKAMIIPSRRADNTELAGDGANLAAVLLAMREWAPVAFAELTAEVLRLLPEFTRLDFSFGTNDTVVLELSLGDGGEVVRADSLSQGVLYLLAMLALAFAPQPPTVICIEEIDRGMHPRMLREIRDTLYRLSHPAAFGLTRPPVQIIATTHSPFMLDLFRDHPEEVVITHKQGSVASFHRLSDRADLPELMKEGSLGDMWFSGILGGVPDQP